jgi:hypothetical protein
MKYKKLPQEFEITELFLVKCGEDFSRTFIGQINRETTNEGKSIVRGSVEVKDGKLWSVAESQAELGKYLDDLCSLKLDTGLHCIAGKKIEFNRFSYYLN